MIVIQVIVGSEHKQYGSTWVVTAFIFLHLFVVSAERLGESIRERKIDYWISDAEVMMPLSLPPSPYPGYEDIHVIQDLSINWLSVHFSFPLEIILTTVQEK